jgi:hypothetical protein
MSARTLEMEKVTVGDAPRPALVMLDGGRPQALETQVTGAPDALPRAFAQFCELCPESGLVDRRALVEGVLLLVQALHPSPEMPDASSPRSVDLPVAALVRDALWQAGRSGRLEQMRSALLQAQLRLCISPKR